MNITRFLKAFEAFWPGDTWAKPSPVLEDPFVRTYFDPCIDIPGMSSIKKLRLLNLAFAHLDESESYLELGTWLGKTLVSATKGNPRRTVYACDNFSEFNKSDQNFDVLRANLSRHGIWEQVQFSNGDFRGFFNKQTMPVPVGLYLNDGPHDEIGQHDAIAHVEDILADEALVLIDDWGRPNEPAWQAKPGTERAVAKSKHNWQRLAELPARFNKDHGMWWNGIGVYAFQRRH